MSNLGNVDGIKAEYLAAEYLKNQGYMLFAKNVKYEGIGEIDIIAFEGRTLAIVEVKYRANKNFGDPLSAVTPSKCRKIIKATELFLAENELDYDAIRFDVLVSRDDNFELFRNAFYGYWL